MSGATGLIGSSVLEAWSATDTELVTVGRSEVDILDPGALATFVKRMAPDSVLHLAWSAGGTAGYREAPENDQWVTISREVATVCLDSGIRFIGTGTVLDDAEDREDGSDRYARSKRTLRAELGDALAAGRVTWLRPFYVFDPQRHRPGVLRAARDASTTDQPVRLLSPDSAHDFVHVSDVARAIEAVVTHEVKGVVDIGSGTTHRVADLVTRAGYAWVPADSTEDPEHDDRTAHLEPLVTTGWAPTHTERFFGDE